MRSLNVNSMRMSVQQQSKEQARLHITMAGIQNERHHSMNPCACILNPSTVLVPDPFSEEMQNWNTFSKEDCLNILEKRKSWLWRNLQNWGTARGWVGIFCPLLFPIHKTAANKTYLEQVKGVSSALHVVKLQNFLPEDAVVAKKLTTVM